MLRIYMVYSNISGRRDGAVLVFASSVREVKRDFFRPLVGVFWEEYTEMEVRWMQNAEHLYAFADQEMLEGDHPHMIDDPPYCHSCELWGNEVEADGLCVGCGGQSGLPDELIEQMLVFGGIR